MNLLETFFTFKDLHRMLRRSVCQDTKLMKCLQTAWAPSSNSQSQLTGHWPLNVIKQTPMHTAGGKQSLPPPGVKRLSIKQVVSVSHVLRSSNKQQRLSARGTFSQNKTTQSTRKAHPAQNLTDSRL